MKRLICLIFVIIIIFALYGCSNKTGDFKNPVKLYYCRDEITYNTHEGVFMYEYREFSGWEDKPRDFLNTHFNKPISDDLISPYPFGAWILDLAQDGNTVNLLLNIHYSRLAPNELTNACACLSLTVFDLLDADTVNLRIDSPTQGRQTITMTKENLFFSEQVSND